MKIPARRIFTAMLALSCFSGVRAGDITDMVNPFMGTATLWKPGDLGYTRTEAKRAWGGETFPGSSLPNAMVQLTPVTNYHTGAGYQYEDHQIYGFAHTAKGHWDLLHLPILPVTRAGKFHPDNYCSWFDHRNESARPGYYSVCLDRYGVKAELTSTLHCGLHRYTFRPQDEPMVMIDIARSNGNPRRWKVEQTGPRSFEGYQDGNGCIYFHAETSRDISDLTIEREHKAPVAVVRFSGSGAPEPVEVRIGFSFVSVEGARANFEAELTGKTFDAVRSDADSIWEGLLGHIKVEGGSGKQRRMLYSTLYRAFLWPALRSDVSGEYCDARGEVVKADFRYYTRPSFWDTYRNKLILLGMISPGVAADIISSCIDDGEKSGGYMPTFFHGDHASAFVAGMWLRGIRGFDLKRAYRLMLRNATVPGRGGRPYLDEYIARGWIAEKDTVNVPTGDEYKGAVTKTVEYAYDDYATALVARALGDRKNYELLMKRSRNYRNLFDPSTGFWRGKVMRGDSGVWISDFRPDYPYYQYMYREADAWNSLLFSPHDPEGAVALYPSKKAVEQKLDSLYHTPNGGYEAWNLTGYLGKYCHGNQPGHSIVYSYYFVGRQDKAQAVIDTLLDRYYGMGDEGLAYAGMDDAGEMSSWYVLNSIGIYTFSPSDAKYIVTVPLFSKVHFSLGSGISFDIVREGRGEHIRAITVGGKTLKGYFVDHKELAAGRELRIFTDSGK